MGTLPPDNSYDAGLLVGLLIGEGSFTGDGLNPAIAVRMHVRHEPIIRWLHEHTDGGHVNGPYFHGGRNYIIWQQRRKGIEPLVAFLRRHLTDELDPHSRARLERMCETYNL